MSKFLNKMNQGARSDPGKILVVSATAGHFGGTERVLEILLAQSAANDRFSFVFLEDGPLVELAGKLKVQHCLIPRKRFSNPIDTVRVVTRIRKYVKDIKPMVSFGWSDYAHLYSYPASMGLCKSVWWQRSNPDMTASMLLCKLFPSLGALANSKFTRDQMQSRGLTVAQTPLYPPFEGHLFTRTLDRLSARRMLGLPEDRVIVGSVGRMQKWKGFDTFVDAVALARKENPNVLGLIVGGKHQLEPAYAEKLRSHIQQHNLQDHILLAGSQRNVAQWMSAMDVFVHTAYREPFGIVVPEAMSLGLPVIASIPGGPSESITDGITGLLVPSGDSTKLFDAITLLLNSPELAKQLGDAAKEQALQFSCSNFALNLETAIDNMIMRI